MKVLVSGYYGFGNLGDEALLSGLLTGLQAHGHEVTVLSHAPHATAALHGVRAVHRLRGLLSAMWQHDALVSGGGGLLQDKTSARSLRYYLGVIGLAKRLGKRTVVYGQSVGPLSPSGQRAVARTLRGVPVAVRDEASRRLLEQLGVPTSLTADAALLLPRPNLSPGRNAPVLLVPRGGYPEATRTLEALAQLLQRARLPVAAMGLQAAEDDAPLRALHRAVPSLEVLRASTPTEALQRVAESHYVVSVRLHGLILAARAGRPFSGLAYDPKVQAFMYEAGGVAHPLGVTPETLLNEVLNPQTETQRLERLTQRAEAGLGWLREALSR